jgi:4,5-dihydroxyphthalate decarboxylase
VLRQAVGAVKLAMEGTGGKPAVHPWIALNLYGAFAAARAKVLAAGVTALASYFETGVVGDDAKRAIASDPMAYGIKATRKVLETIADYVHAQGLTDRRVKIEELLALSTDL